MSNDLFYSNMSNLLYQWSDFRVSKNLYKYYFAAMKTNSSSGSSSDDAKTKEVDSSKLKNAAEDRLTKVTSEVTSAYSTLKTKLETGGEEETEFDSASAYEAAKSFVTSYNDMMNVISKSGNSTVSGKAHYISTMTSSYRGDLDSVGITINGDGTLNIDEATFTSASQDQMKAVFTDKGSFGAFVNTTTKSLNEYSTSGSYTNPTGSTASSASSSAKTTESSSEKKTESTSNSVIPTTSATYDIFGNVSEKADGTTASALLDYLV